MKKRGAISSIIICGNLSISNSLLTNKATKHGIEKTISRAWLYPTVFVPDTEKWRLNVIELAESETNVDSSPSYPEIPRTVRSNHVLMKDFQLENDAELQKLVLDPLYSPLSSMFPTSGLDINNNDHSCTGNK